MLFFRNIFIAIILIILASACKTEVENDLPIVGVKIYNWEGDYKDLFKTWQETGINTVFASKELLSDDKFRTGLREKGIKSFLIFPVFFDTDALENDPGLYAIQSNGKPAIDDWVHFICPTREDYRKQKIEQARKYIDLIQPDAISIDFIRNFVFWESVFPDNTIDSLPQTCFDPYCIQKFQEDTQIGIPENLIHTSEIADWIHHTSHVEWTNWKCQQITLMIEQIGLAVKEEKPDILVNVHLVPWRSGDYDGAIRKVAGQDVTRIKDYADYLSPMTYSHMVKRKPEWIHSVVEDIYNGSSGKVLPSIQVSKAYLDIPMSNEEFSACIEQAILPPSKGVVFWSWDHLVASPEKLEIVKGYFGK